jgi:uncharacterized protein YndB with AHSA1/START domain
MDCSRCGKGYTMESSTAIRLYVQKDFSVPRERLFEAWTREEELKKWWRPMGNQLERVVNELKEGGQVRYEFTNAEGGHPVIIEGVYQAVQGRERLVYTWNWNLADDAIRNAEFLLRVEFLEQGQGSRLQVAQENFSNEESMQPHREGWDKALQELKNFLEQQ